MGAGSTSREIVARDGRRYAFADHNCFACGAGNPIGMGLHIELGEGTARAAWTVGDDFVGWSEHVAEATEIGPDVWVLEGEPEWVSWRKSWPGVWYGVRRFFKWLESKAYKMHIRVLLSKYRSYTPCEVCAGRGVIVHHDPVVKHRPTGGGGSSSSAR